MSVTTLPEGLVYVIQGAIRTGDYSVSVLKSAHAELSRIGVRTFEVNQLQAEVSFLLAQTLRESDMTRARELARESVGLYERLNIQTLEDAAPMLWERLPDYMHEGVVRNRLNDLLKE